MRPRIELAAVLFVGAMAALTACGGDKPAAEKSVVVEEAEVALPPFELESDLPPSVREAVLKPFGSPAEARGADPRPRPRLDHARRHRGEGGAK